MQIKVGTDIIVISRIEKLVKLYHNKFLNRVFTKKEIEYAEKSNKNMVAALAKRYALKEAFAKAIGSGLGKVSFKDIEVVNESENSKPIMVISSNLRNYMVENYSKNFSMDFSLSDDGNFAIAVVNIIFWE